MMRSGGRLLVECLLALGAAKSFGVPGESYLAVLDALHDTTGKLDYVLCRNEGGAAFMASAYGKLTGSPGICFVTRGPGATNASIGVHTAMQDSSPMILFVGQVGTEHEGARGLSGGRLSRGVRHACEVGGRDRRRCAPSRDRGAGLDHGADRAAGTGRRGAAGGHAHRHDGSRAAQRTGTDLRAGS